MLNRLVSSLKKEKPQINNDHPKQFQINLNQNSLKQIDWKIQILNLQDYIVAEEKIDKIYYLMDFLNGEQQEYIWGQIYAQENANRWHKLHHSLRRVQRIGGIVTNQGLIEQESLQDYLKILVKLLNESQICNITLNHALINEYERGTGIMNHQDGPMYEDFVNIISLGGMFDTPNKIIYNTILEQGSLLIFTCDAYNKWYHSIRYYDEDVIPIYWEDGKIIRSGVENANKSNLLKQAQLIINQNQYEEEQINFEYQNHQCSIINVKNNPKFNRAIQIKRRQRVSITIRHAYLNEEIIKREQQFNFSQQKC